MPVRPIGALNVRPVKAVMRISPLHVAPAWPCADQRAAIALCHDFPVARTKPVLDRQVALGVVEAPYISVMGDRRSFARIEFADFGRLRLLALLADSSGRYLSSGFLPSSRGLRSCGFDPPRGLRPLSSGQPLSSGGPSGGRGYLSGRRGGLSRWCRFRRRSRFRRGRRTGLLLGPPRQYSSQHYYEKHRY